MARVSIGDTGKLNPVPKLPAGPLSHRIHWRRHGCPSASRDRGDIRRSSNERSQTASPRLSLCGDNVIRNINSTSTTRPGWMRLRHVKVHQVPACDAAAILEVPIEGPGGSSTRRNRILRIGAEDLACLNTTANFKDLDAESIAVHNSGAMLSNTLENFKDKCLNAMFDGLETWIWCQTEEDLFSVSIHARFAGAQLQQILAAPRDFRCSWRLCNQVARIVAEPTVLGVNSVDVDGVGEAATPAGFRLNLLPHQRRSLAWMIRREKFGLEELCVCDNRRDKPICPGLNLRLEVRVENTFFLRGGLLCDVVGSGKTATMLALVMENSSHTYVPAKCRSENCKSTLTKATLVLCPANVHEQWLTETQKFCPDKFRAIPLRTLGDLHLASVSDLIEADLVVAPYDIFAVATTGLSNKLEHIVWHRIVLDEFHELCSKRSPTDALRNAQILSALRSIEVAKRWGISGTPESFLSSPATVAHASLFYRCDVNARSASMFVEHFCRQARISIPVQVHQHMVHVTQTADEQAVYLEKKGGFLQVETSLSWSDVENCMKRDSSHMRNLLTLCSHFTTSVAQGERLSADQVCKRMLQAKCDEVIKEKRMTDLFTSSLASVEFANSKGKLDDILTGGDKKLVMVKLETAESELLRKACEHVPFVCDRLRDVVVEDLNFLEVLLEVADVCKALKKLFRKFTELREREETLQKLSEQILEYISELGVHCSRIIAAHRRYVFFKRTWETLHGQMDSVTCPICLEAVDAFSAYILLCGHVLCTDCAPNLPNLRCPECRFEIPQLNGCSVRLGPEVAIPPTRIEDLSLQENAGNPVEESSERVHWSSKLRKFVEMIEYVQLQDEGAKIIVFMQWESFRIRTSEVLTEIGVRHVFLTGDVIERTRALDEFRSDSSIPLLLLSLEHSASGTNLTVASHVFLMHPMLASCQEEVSSYEAQAIGRVLRMGQTRPVHVWRFVTSNTVEEGLWRLCENTASLGVSGSP